MNVPFVDLRAQYRSLASEVQRAISAVLERGDFILGKEVSLFEEEFAGVADELIYVGPLVEASESGAQVVGDLLLFCGGGVELLALFGLGVGLRGGGDLSGGVGHVVGGQWLEGLRERFDAPTVFEVADFVVLHVGEGLVELVGHAVGACRDLELFALGELELAPLELSIAEDEAFGVVLGAFLSFDELLESRLEFLESSLDERGHFGLADDGEDVGG